MSGWALSSPGMTVLDRFDTSITTEFLTTVTASGSTNTKGSWVELDASTSQDTHLLVVNMRNSYISATNTGMLVDIGTGAAASETVLIANIAAGWKFNITDGDTNAFPIYVPAGTRIAARCQAVIASDTVDVGVRLLSRPNSFLQDMRQGGNVVTYGADTTNTRGTLVTGAGVANTKGSWVEITSSTTEPHSALAISLQGHTDTSLSTQTMLLDIGFGASSSEQVLIKDLIVQQFSSERVPLVDPQVAVLTIGRNLPAGSRLVARLQAPTNSNDHISLCLHGIT